MNGKPRHEVLKMNIRIDAFLLSETISEIISSIIFTTSQKFWKSFLTPKTHQMFSVHNKTEEFENGNFFFPDSKISPSLRYRIRCGFNISHPGSGFKNLRIRRMRVDGDRIREEKVVDSKISRYVWTGLKYKAGIS